MLVQHWSTFFIMKVLQSKMKVGEILVLILIIISIYLSLYMYKEICVTFCILVCIQFNKQEQLIFYCHSLFTKFTKSSKQRHNKINHCVAKQHIVLVFCSLMNLRFWTNQLIKWFNDSHCIPITNLEHYLGGMLFELGCILIHKDSYLFRSWMNQCFEWNGWVNNSAIHS